MTDGNKPVSAANQSQNSTDPDTGDANKLPFDFGTPSNARDAIAGDPSNSATESKLDFLLGKEFGDYVIRRLIGRGGMARVYEGYDAKLNRVAAVKVVHAPADQEAQLKQRFFKEARIAGNLDHPNIITVYQFGEVPGLYYMAMRLLEGRTLLNLILSYRKQNRHFEPDQIISILREVASALDYAHSQNVLHRDIKPSNIMLTNNGRVVLMDFGLTMTTDGDSTLGTAFGTPRYIAPEQAISSQKAVPQSDIYSLGVIMYEMLTGQTPFDSDSPMSMALSHITNPPPLPRSIRPEIPEAVEMVVMKALEKRPERRWQSATEMVNALTDAYKGIAPNYQPKSEPTPTQKVNLPSNVLIQGFDDNSPLLTSAGKNATQPLDATPSMDRSIADGSLSTHAASTQSIVRKWGLVSVFAVALLALLITWWLVTNAVGAPPLATTGSIVQPPSEQIHLIYNKDMLAIYNASDQKVALDRLRFIRGDNTALLDVESLTPTNQERFINLEAKQCIRIQRSTVTTDSPLPIVCGPQTAPIILQKLDQLFWLQGEAQDNQVFYVKRGDRQLQVCYVGLNTCIFSVP